MQTHWTAAVVHIYSSNQSEIISIISAWLFDLKFCIIRIYFTGWSVGEWSGAGRGEDGFAAAGLIHNSCIFN